MLIALPVILMRAVSWLDGADACLSGAHGKFD